ncbi:TIR domain-containing protein [Treponema vincentii]|uniref:TIR domain-containing protein n=1 Tax=Treponema vincentii TaxID=69710 RepID=UPI003D90E97E
MIASFYYDRVSRVEKEIADLQKKIADETKRELDKNKNISNIERSITQHSSLSTIQSKQRQIQNYQHDILNIKSKITDYQKKIADKTIELGKRKQELQKAEEADIKKNQREQLLFQQKLEKDIKAQKDKLDILISQNYSNIDKPLVSSYVEPKEYDFFISHASEDKDSIVRELAVALQAEGIKVWYDEFILKIGDSLRKSIDKGLVNSRYGIVIISPDFIKKNWTEYELNGMIAKEMNGHKVVLPIWHKVTKNEVINYSPSLADKLALNTSIHTIKEIVTSLKKLLNDTVKNI